MLDGVIALTFLKKAACGLEVVLGVVRGLVLDFLEEAARLLDVPLQANDACLLQLDLVGVVTDLLGLVEGLEGLVELLLFEQSLAEIEVGERSLGELEILDGVAEMAEEILSDGELEMPALA